VNLCQRCIADPALPGRLAGLLAQHGLPAGQLILEITESVTADADAARAEMAQLRAAGVQISVDDSLDRPGVAVLPDQFASLTKQDRSGLRLVDGRLGGDGGDRTGDH
jgi:hypothetical protein